MLLNHFKRNGKKSKQKISEKYFLLNCLSRKWKESEGLQQHNLIFNYKKLVGINF